MAFFSERERSLYVVVRPSVCLSSVCLYDRAPTQATEIVGNVCTPFGTLGKNFTEIVPGESLRPGRGVKRNRSSQI